MFPLPVTGDVSSAVTPVAVTVDKSSAVTTVTSFGDRALVRGVVDGARKACIAAGAFWRHNVVFVGLDDGSVEVLAYHRPTVSWLTIGAVSQSGKAPTSPVRTHGVANWSLLDIVEEQQLANGSVRFVVCAVLRVPGSTMLTHGPPSIAIFNVEVSAVNDANNWTPTMNVQQVLATAVSWASQASATIVASSVIKLPSVVADLLRQGDVFHGSASNQTVPTGATTSTSGSAAGSSSTAAAPSTTTTVHMEATPPIALHVCVVLSTGRVLGYVVRTADSGSGLVAALLQHNISPFPPGAVASLSCAQSGLVALIRQTQDGVSACHPARVCCPARVAVLLVVRLCHIICLSQYAVCSSIRVFL